MCQMRDPSRLGPRANSDTMQLNTDMLGWTRLQQPENTNTGWGEGA